MSIQKIRKKSLDYRRKRDGWKKFNRKQSLCKIMILLYPNSKELDLTNIDEIKKWIKINNPDIVIHTAAKVGGIHANIAEPTSFLLTNLKININVIEAAYESKIKYFLNLGSSCMYPRYADNPLKEESILTGELEPTNEGYALAKICAARLCKYLSTEDKTIFFKTLIPCNLIWKI